MATSEVTLEQARKAASAAQQKLNGKTVDAFPTYLTAQSDSRKLYIFNVGLAQWNRSLGDYGNFHVDGRKEGEQVSAPLVIDGIPYSYVTDDMRKMRVFMEPGGAMAIAQDILFVGRGYAPQLNGEKWGLFISETPEPSQKQIKAAQAKLRTTQAQLIADADDLERQNKRQEISSIHREAAMALGSNRPWMVQEPREVSNCPACQQTTDVEAVSCKSCGAILDWERAKIYFPEKYLAYQAAQAAAK